MLAARAVRYDTRTARGIEGERGTAPLRARRAGRARRLAVNGRGGARARGDCAVAGAGACCDRIVRIFGRRGRVMSYVSC